MNNYPEGTEHDPNAPWNELHTYCPSCDSKELDRIARSMANDMASKANESLTYVDPNNEDEYTSEEDFYDECYQKVMDESRSCAQCYLEDNEDDWREEQ